MMRDRRRRTSTLRASAAAAALLATLASAVASSAGEDGRAERLYTRGLAELHAGRTDAAVGLFTEAVSADPSNIRALYYRGLGLGHAGRYEEAAADLDSVVKSGAPVPRARLELGYALSRTPRLDEAADALAAAATQPDTAAEATLLLGIVETRRGRYDEAHAALDRAIALDPSRATSVRYYRGLANYRSGDLDAAADDFAWVEQKDAGGPLGREASAFLARIRESTVQSVHLYAASAFEYDSNVALAPDDEALAENVYGVSDRADGRAVMRAGGRWSFYTSPRAHLSVGYDFLQSLHFDLSEYDVQTHKATGQAALFFGPATVGLTALYEYSFLDMESFATGGTFTPWVRFDEGDFGRTEVYYRGRSRDFILDPFDPVRDSFNHAAGARQFFSLGSPGREAMVGYRFDADVADGAIGRPYDYNGHQFEGGLAWPLAGDILLDAMYVYRLEDYSQASFDRDDDEHQAMARVEKRLGRLVWVSASYLFRHNGSDQKSFEYDRHIGSIGVEVRY